MLPGYQKVTEKFLLPVFTGLLVGFAVLYIIPWLAWFMLVPLYYSIFAKPKGVFLKGLTGGSVAGMLLFSWMISSSRLYTGASPYIGFPLWICCVAAFGVVMGLAMSFFNPIRINDDRKNAWWLNALIAASVWVVLDWVRTISTPGIPWTHFQFLHTQSRWILPLQLVSFIGGYGLTFLIVCVNVMLAEVLITRKYIRLLIPVSVYACLLLTGVFKLALADPGRSKIIRVALLCENMEARKRWLPETGDSLASIFFDLNKHAVKNNPQLILWSESAIPWDFAMDDELIPRCLKITWPARAGHIIGIFSPSERDTAKRYNSAYYFEPDGAITGRYDKVQLLTFLEKPLLGARIPFFRGSAHTDLLPGRTHKLLKTPYGNAGVLICNEILVYQPFHKILKKNAGFIAVMANNAWFEGSNMILHHFYTSRIRAVEAGKDLVINSNRGLSGIIESDGVIQVCEAGDQARVISGTIQPSRDMSVYARLGDWFVVVSALFLISIIALKFFISN